MTLPYFVVHLPCNIPCQDRSFPKTSINSRYDLNSELDPFWGNFKIPSPMILGLDEEVICSNLDHYP